MIFHQIIGRHTLQEGADLMMSEGDAFVVLFDDTQLGTFFDHLIVAKNNDAVKVSCRREYRPSLFIPQIYEDDPASVSLAVLTGK